MMPEFDHYTVSRVLGEGAMGLVYLAHDRRNGLPVAIKVMSLREFDPDVQAAFLKESRSLAALGHRNVVRCLEVTESADGVLSVAMEYVDGVDFRAFEGRSFAELLPLMIQALAGLAFLRSRNVLHRDLSSNNIFVTLENQTRVTKILDLGVAKMLEEKAAEAGVKTRSGQFLGKFAYASPEHFSASSIDWRSDVYSLGVIFHRLLTRQMPIVVARQGNFFDWLMAHQKENTFDVAAPADLPALPDALRGVVRKMLSRNPDDRPQSYDEIVAVLERVQRSLPLALQPDLLALRTLPPPADGKAVSSPSTPAMSPPADRFPPADVASSASLEVSQQKRWPDLDVPESHTERFEAFSSPARAPAPSPVPAAPPAPPPRAPEPEPEPEPKPVRAPAAAPVPAPTPAPESAPTPPPSYFFSSSIPAMPSPPVSATAAEIPAGGNPATTDMLPPPPFPDATTTASIEFSGKSDIFPEISSWAPREMPTQPGSASPSSELREDKTERLDDVIEKLRLQSHKAPLPPLEPPAAPRSPSSPGRTLDVRPDDASQAAHHTGENTPMTPALHRSAEHVSMAPASLRTSPMAPASDRTSPMGQTPTPHRSGEQAPRRSGEQAPAPRQPARRLFVYGEPPGAVLAPPPAVPRAAEFASAPAPPAAAPAASGLRLPSLRVGLIVAAIVVLFAAILFVLVALARRGAAGEAPRGSRSGSAGEIAAAA